MPNGVGVEQTGALWDLIRWVHKRRPLLTAVFVLAVIAAALVDDAPPAQLLRPRWTVMFVLPWLLMTVGVGVRIWGAGNLSKNREITRTGVYQMVRHPLYLGSLAMFLAMFITVGNPWVGLGIFAAMVTFVYYPTMMDEEAFLTGRFPEQTTEYAHLPRLLPNLRRLPTALESDRFTFRSAWNNFGTRSLGFLVALPLLLEILRWVESRLRG